MGMGPPTLVHLAKSSFLGELLNQAISIKSNQEYHRTYNWNNLKYHQGKASQKLGASSQKAYPFFSTNITLNWNVALIDMNMVSSQKKRNFEDLGLKVWKQFFSLLKSTVKEGSKTSSAFFPSYVIEESNLPEEAMDQGKPNQLKIPNPQRTEGGSTEGED
ncbi:hypothetical protein O181_038034 [Austropuccinia psidii MF-1]|uniref:Uncharacterized protein n=1 Tax=Austropuccinia psidii MF-1 TaxID=1389203 RepID=A0A9Q3D7K0_9BASI|nr:hypothetical protein [Austropuccinia psidii MF-1]